MTMISSRNNVAWHAIALVLLPLTLGSRALAADPVREGEVPQPADAVAAKSPEGTPASELERKLSEITSKMSQVTNQLTARQTGLPTQELQKQILAELDELLKTPPQDSPPSSGGSGGGGGSSSQKNSSSPPSSQNPSSQDRSSPSSSKPDESPSNDNQGEKKPGNGGEQDREGAEDSEERTGSRKEAQIPTLPRRRMEVDVWGHLHENVREQLLNSYGERMVPEYADLVQRFYQSLAETGSSGNNQRSGSR